ncbi:MAG: AraC family transcriptional regulator ligand-binding domain-containing protein, partial [Myxococcota bacterium]
MRDAGIDLRQVALQAGLEPPQQQGALSVTEATRLLDASFSSANDTTLGLRIGTLIKPELLGVVGLAAISAPSFRHAIARCARYKRLFSALHIHMEEHADGSVVRITYPQTHSSARWQIDIELAFLVSFGRQMASPPVTPLKVQ